MTMNWVKYSILILFALSLTIVNLAGPGAIAGDRGQKNVYLISQTGEETKVATLSFTRTDRGASYKIEYDYTKFSDHFLSMRPFKCLETSAQMICHLPYPYKSRRSITRDDLQDLEYDFLYIHKSPGEYGINFWNGIYYKIERMPDGSFRGALMETDLDVLASPPKDFARPITHAALNKNEDGKHYFPKLLIR